MSRLASEPSNLLLLSAGSKMAVARIAKESTKTRGITLHISDTNEFVPTRSAADAFTVLPDSENPNWANALLALCETHRIALIIPTRHSDLIPLAQIRDRLNLQGTEVSLPHYDTLKLCIHKFDTYNFLKSQNLPSPFTCLKSDYRGKENEIKFPLIAKPESGSASIGVLNIYNPLELEGVPEDWILQNKASGIEYTTNLYLNTQGQALCAIPHQRISVQSGEVSQARTQRIPELIDLCIQAAQALPRAQGIINIQAFVDEGAVELIEINPRIGGGYPLCDKAKGRYIEWLCQEFLDGTTPPTFDDWTEGLRMMRFRDAVFEL